MDRDIARLNIDHFRNLLASETDGAKRAVLHKLLAEEEGKLMNAENDLAKRKLKN